MKATIFRNVILVLSMGLIVCSCEVQNTTEPDSNVVPQDPKCLLSTQWSIDYAFPTPHPDEYWFMTPTVNFNTEKEGFFDVGVQTGKFRNNPTNQFYEVHFTYSVVQDRVVFEIKKVIWFKGVSSKIGEETGATAIATAKELMNFVNLNNGIKFNCNGRKLKFDATEPVTRVPFGIYNWKRTN